MPEFVVHFVDPLRGTSQARVHATDAQAAVGAARVEAHRVVAVEPEAEPAREGAGSRGKRFPLRLFSQELAVLLGAGIPLLEGLQTLREKETSTGVARALDVVIGSLQGGEPLSAALRAQPECFDSLYVAVVQSSERTGQLEQALREHADYLAWVDALRSKLVSASIYPLTLIVAGMGVIVFLLLFVVPRFAGILEGVGGSLPPSSRLLIELGHIGGEHPWATVLCALALLAVPVVVWRHPGVQAWATARLWETPMLGPKLHVLALAQLYRTASMLLGAGVPVVAALNTTHDVISIRLRSALKHAVDSIGRGERFSTALHEAGLTTPVSLRMVRVGERSGRLGPMLRQAAQFHDEELTRLTDLVTHLVNPLLMLVMGVIIGGMVVLMYMPIFQLVEQVQ